MAAVHNFQNPIWTAVFLLFTATYFLACVHDRYDTIVVPKNGSCGIVYYQTINLGIQSKLYEQIYSQMIFEI